MIDERKEETASLYVLDLLEGEERSLFEAELARDPELRQWVDDLRQTNAQFALTAPQKAPSPALKARVLASISAAKLPGSGVGTPLSVLSAPSAKGGPEISSASATVVPFRLTAWLGWGVAACFALVSGYLSFRYMSARADALLQQRNAEYAALELKSLQQTLEAERIVTGRQIADLKQASDLAQLKIAKLASLNKNSPEAIAIAIWNPLKQEGVLTVESLPFIQQDQDYQLWVVDPHYKDPVNGGVFRVDEKGTARLNFRPDQPVSGVTTFAITRERKGGVPKAEGPFVALGAL